MTTSEAANWANDWHHLVVVLPAGGSLASTAIYLDGNELTTTGGSGSFSTAAGPLVIGGGVTGGAGPFSGNVGPTMIFSRAFGAGQVNSLDANPAAFYGDRALAAFYNLNEDAGTTIDDLSSNANTLTASGATWTTGPIIAASASFTLSEPVGNYTVEAVYSGNNAYAGTTGEMTESIIAAPSGPTIDNGNGAAAATTGTVGTAVTLSVNSPNFFDDYSWSVSYTPTTGSGDSPYASGHGTYFSFTPTAQGVYSVSVTDTDAANSSASSTASISVTSGTAAGVSIAGLPGSTSPEGTPLELSASVSNPTGRYSYQWTVSEGGTPVASGVGSTFDFARSRPGVTPWASRPAARTGRPSASSEGFSATAVAPVAIYDVTQTDNAAFTATFTNAYDPATGEMSGLKYAFADSTTDGSPNWGTASDSASHDFSFFTPGIYTLYGEVIGGESGQNPSTTYQTTVVVVARLTVLGRLPATKAAAAPTTTKARRLRLRWTPATIRT